MIERPLRARTAIPLLLLATIIAAGEARVWRLLDEQGNPYSGVEVSVLGRTGSVTTDGEGRFRLLPTPVPPFELAVFDARGALLGRLKVASLDEAPDLVLRPLVGDSIKVLSGAAPATLAPPAAAATVFSAEERRERKPAHLVDAIREIPGAGKVGPGQTAVPSLRGLARGRTLILLDDARVVAERRAGPSATYLNPFSVESIEVVRGPGSVAYGSDAFGGVLHARTPAPHPDAFAGRFEVGAGVGQPLASGAVEVNAPLGRAALLAQVHARSASDYRSPEGVVQESSWRDRGVLLRGLLPTERTRMTMGLQVDRGRDIERPRADPTSPLSVYPEENSDRLTFDALLPSPPALDSLELDAFIGKYRLVTDRVEVDPTGTVERSDVDASDASLRVIAARPWASGLLRFGLDTSSRFDLSAENFEFRKLPGGGREQVLAETTIESARRLDAGVFVEMERPFPGIASSVSVGLRGDHVETRNEGGGFGDRSSSNDSPSGFAAFTWQPADPWSTTVQYAHGFRDARLSDRYFSGVTGRGRIEGNPDLEPETSDQLDLAVRASLGAVRLGFFGYRYRIGNLIERFRVAPQGDLFRFRNRGAVELRGVELEGELELNPGLDLRIAANWAEGEIQDDGSAPNDVPPESLSVTLWRKLPGRLWWRLGVTAVAPDDDPGSTERPTPGYTLVDASAGFTLGSGLEARLIAGNLLDTRYPDSADEDAPLAPGFTLAFVIGGKF